MKVLVLHSELGVLRGGGENFTRNLFSNFAQRGHHIEAAFVADANGNYPVPLPSCIHPLPLRGWWSRNLGQTMFSSISNRIPSEGWAMRTIDRVKDAVHWRTIRWHNQRFQRRATREFANCWTNFDVLYVHGDPILANQVARHRPTVLRLPGPVSSELASHLRAIHAVCANGDALANIRGFLQDNVMELPVGVDEKLFYPGSSCIRRELGWTSDNRVVGYVGRLTRLKGVDFLARAFHEISRATPELRLLIIGNGEEKNAITSVLARDIARGIVYIRSDLSHEQLPEWYRAMDLLVMPSRYENFSNALLEGMACGIPFLASDVGGNRIMVNTGGGGWLFEAGSVSSLMETLRTLLSNDFELKARSKAGNRYIQTHHRWPASAAALEKIIGSRLGVQ